MSRFELCKFTPTPDPELICGICMNVLDTPDETPCRHVFCHDCILTAIRENQKCPVCRAPCREGQTKEVLPLVQNLINKLTMRCDYFDNGCTDLILKEFFLDHVISCEFEMVQCRYKSCGQSLLRRDCEQHELNTCAYRDRVCENGCGLMIPQENASSHKCVEALVELVKDLKEKNQDLQKRINELQHSSESVAQSETSVAVQASQRDDDDQSFHSFSYGNISDSSFNDTSSFSSHSWDTDIVMEAAWNEINDLVNNRVDRRRSSRLAALPHGSESDPSASRHLGESDQSHTSEILGNDNSSDRDNADMSLNNGEITVGIQTDHQMIQDIKNGLDICRQELNEMFVLTRTGMERGESSSLLDSSSNGALSKTSTECLSVGTRKRELEEDSGFCDDNTARTQIKQPKRSNPQPINTQAEEIALMSTGLTAFNTSDTSLLDGANESLNGITGPICDAAINVNSGSGLTVAYEVAAAEPLTNITEVSQIGNTLTDPSDSTNTVSSSCNLRVSVNPLRQGPVTRSRGQDGHVALEGNAIPYVKVPPTCAYLLDMYAQEDDSSEDESWSPSDEN
ncbi:unnamed protein product [Candidula unifasciata]|uniref:Uncharacterized protein n=1 Tax=Candidula unifasciata TaxID=100452 RepID=A0A8S4A972_9EUPU|nr:unnamed protein product [Candidula unifasciata]